MLLELSPRARRKSLCSIWCVVAAVLPSCSVSVPKQGVKYDAAVVSTIKPCETSRDELVRSLGQPYRKGIVSGLDQWTWYYYPGYTGMTAAAAEEAGRNTQHLIVAFNPNGQVVDFVYNPPTNVIWTPERRCGQK